MSKTRGSNVGVTVSAQDIHEASATQYYRLGTRLVRGERTFKYAKAGATLTTSLLAWYNDYQINDWSDITTSSPAGSHTVYVVIGATDGVAGNGLIAAHELQGGYVTIFKLNNGVEHTDFTFEILDNNATVVNVGGTITLTIDAPLPYKCDADAAGCAAEITGNPYSDVRTGNSGGYRGMMGIPMAAATTALPYVWLQTWGPAWVRPQISGTVAVGDIAHNNQVVARHDGSIQAHEQDNTYAEKAQHVGYVFTRKTSANNRALSLIMLQISP